MTKPQQAKLDAKSREAQILTAALKLAESQGAYRITLQQVADAAGVAKSLPLVYFGTMVGFRRKLMREAVRTCNLRVVAQGLAANDPHAKKAPPELRAKAAQSLAG